MEFLAVVFILLLLLGVLLFVSNAFVSLYEAVFLPGRQRQEENDDAREFHRAQKETRKLLEKLDRDLARRNNDTGAEISGYQKLCQKAAAIDQRLRRPVGAQHAAPLRMPR